MPWRTLDEIRDAEAGEREGRIVAVVDSELRTALTTAGQIKRRCEGMGVEFVRENPEASFRNIAERIIDEKAEANTGFVQ
jgi:hypothetical protein